MNKINISKYIDHTLLKANATDGDIKALCIGAEKYDFASVCVNPYNVPTAKKLLLKSSVKLCTVIGFPLGAAKSEVKVFETQKAVLDGADELDMVMNIGKFLSADYEFVSSDIKQVRAVCENKILKVIIETAYLTNELKIKACKLAKEAKADFVKTSTGFAPAGAKAEDVKLMRLAVGSEMGVKASGGIKDYETALKMINAGATRIGTSSGIEIMQGKVSRTD